MVTDYDLLKNVQCPLETRDRDGYPTTDGRRGQTYDYGANAHVRANVNSNTASMRIVKKKSVVKMPSKLYNYLDTKEYNPTWNTGMAAAVSEQRYTDRHKYPNANIAYFDGHVAFEAVAFNGTYVTSTNDPDVLTKWWRYFRDGAPQGERP